jgi:membrane protein implicated in regulation of membrane protease activity
MQTKRQSMVETGVNIFSGMLISFLISQIAAIISNYTGWFTWNISTTANIGMTILLTIVSILRSYTWRRYFNKVHNNVN